MQAYPSRKTISEQRYDAETIVFLIKICKKHDLRDIIHFFKLLRLDLSYLDYFKYKVTRALTLGVVRILPKKTPLFKIVDSYSYQ